MKQSSFHLNLLSILHMLAQSPGVAVRVTEHPPAEQLSQNSFTPQNRPAGADSINFLNIMFEKNSRQFPI